MSNLIFPFLFKRNLLNRHNIKYIFPFFQEDKFFTGAKTGEVIIWSRKNENFVPSLILLPGLNQNVGPLTSMTVMKLPDPDLMVITFIPSMNKKAYSNNCLVTVHTDNRLRIWDLNDGRCISISSHDLFINESEIKEIRPLFSEMKRFLICLGIDFLIRLMDRRLQ